MQTNQKLLESVVLSTKEEEQFMFVEDDEEDEEQEQEQEQEESSVQEGETVLLNLKEIVQKELNE